MNGDILRRTITITNPQGVHMRRMQAFVEAAQRFQAQVWLQKPGGPRLNGRSMIHLLGLAAEKGETLTVEADGADAAQALDVLEEVLLTVPPEDQ